MARKSKRQKAIMRRNLFLICVSTLLIVVLSLCIAGCTIALNNNNSTNNSTNSTQSSKPNGENDDTNSTVSTTPIDTTPKPVQLGDFKGDANYNRLILVNNKNPLPADHDYNANLTVAPLSYKKGSTDEIYRMFDKDMWPYLKAMMDAARADGIDIGIISAWRSYDTQRILFEDKVKRLMNSGYSKEAAEKEAATCIALPGTSEHHTGLAVDFNSTNQSFENTKTFTWLKEHAADYGFILRYPNDKMDITGGIIYEPWHWRFVGISVAKEMNSLDMCLEEYLEYKGFKQYSY